MYIPFDAKLNINPQDDTFLGQDHLDLASVPAEDFPLESKWPWLKVLQYDALKQPDVVLLNFLLSDQFSPEQKEANYKFYELRTTHDSSLSPSIHSIMAAEAGLAQDAYDYFMYSTRLDLDYGNPSDGIHLANAGGAWMAIVNGFAGMRWKGERLYFDPAIPSCWKSYSFTIQVQTRIIKISVKQDEAVFGLEEGERIGINIRGQDYLLDRSVESSVRILEIGKKQN
jgi:alpha,alpha-trehalose phosphorylase